MIRIRRPRCTLIVLPAVMEIPAIQLCIYNCSLSIEATVIVREIESYGRSVGSLRKKRVHVSREDRATKGCV